MNLHRAEGPTFWALTQAALPALGCLLAFGLPCTAGAAVQATEVVARSSAPGAFPRQLRPHSPTSVTAIMTRQFRPTLYFTNSTPSMGGEKSNVRHLWKIDLSPILRASKAS
jgi:hypothetical protein